MWMTKPQFRVKQICLPSTRSNLIKRFKKQKLKWTLKNCWANKFSKTTISIRFNLLQVCPSMPIFVFIVLLMPSFYVLSGYFPFHLVWWRFPLFEFCYISWHSSFNRFCGKIAPNKSPKSVSQCSLTKHQSSLKCRLRIANAKGHITVMIFL